MAMASAFVDGALQDLELLPIIPYYYDQLKILQRYLKNLRTFLLCARGCGGSAMGSLLNRLEDSLIQNGKDLHDCCLRQSETRNLYRVAKQINVSIKSYFQEIMESYIILLDLCSLQFWYHSKEFFYSLLVNMAHTHMAHRLMDQLPYKQILALNLLDALKHKLEFFINFVRLAEFRGLEPCRLQVLVTHLHVVAVNAARLCWQWEFVENEDGAISLDEFKLEVSKLLLKIKSVDPEIHEIYVRVLAATNISRLSDSPTLETDKHVLGDFVDTLLSNILKALEYGDSCIVSLKDQVPILYEGLRFLRTILTKHLEKIDELHKKAKDLIGAAINEAIIVICPFPVHEFGEGLVKEKDFVVLNFLERIKLIKVITSAFIFPKNNELDFMDSLLENLKELPSCRVDSIAFAKDQIQTVQEDLASLRSFLESIQDDSKHSGNLQILWNRVIEVAYKTHSILQSLVVGDIPNCSHLEFETIIEEINLIKLERLKIVENHCNSDSEAQKTINTFNPLASQGSTPAINKYVVTLDDEANTIIKRLTAGLEKLDIISIVGMPGLGKTTLARSVYDNPSVKDLFHISAWCVVSQAYKKKDLLLQILGSVAPNFCANAYSKDEQGLEEELRQCLLRKRYLIVLDDVWDIEAWNCLERSFPDDAYSSRILLTSRDSEVAKKINPNREPHFLRQLTDDECWDLLRNKLSCPESYPSDLGIKIAKNCRGLPLTVVIVAGILANSDQVGWEEIAGRLSSSALSSTDQCMNVLELSFKKLPEKLKSCFLYFGSFPGDEEILVKKLMWLWIAEGFIEKSDLRSPEDVAMEYMNDLISRSLVMVFKERSMGGVRTCRIHDLLHEFCLIKAKKKKFISLIRGHDELFTFHGQHNLQRLCVYSTKKEFENSKLSCPGAHSLLFFAKDDSLDHDISVLFHFFKHLKVLNLAKIRLGRTFPSEIALLVELRYLAIRGLFDFIPSEIANLSNLEILIVFAYHISLPHAIWNMSKLRVLRSSTISLPYDREIDWEIDWEIGNPEDWEIDWEIVNPESSSNLYNFDTFSLLRLSFGESLEKIPRKLPKGNPESSSNLYNLDTFSLLRLSSGESLEMITRKLPNIRKLKCELSGESNADCDGIVVMDFLSRLESLHLKLTRWARDHIGFRFPLCLKKLTLSGFRSSIIPKSGQLPNLVVLKLSHIHFEKRSWDMSEEWEFPKLKFLQLCYFRIERWTGTEGVNHFPCLEKLVLQDWGNMKEVPSCLGDITTLQMIKLRHCHESVASLFQKIKEEQGDWGNDDLQVLLEDIWTDDKWIDFEYPSAEVDLTFSKIGRFHRTNF